MISNRDVSADLSGKLSRVTHTVTRRILCRECSPWADSSLLLISINPSSEIVPRSFGFSQRHQTNIQSGARDVQILIAGTCPKTLGFGRV